MRPNDVPELPFKKPKSLEKLQLMTLSQRDSMDPWERKDKIQETANELSQAFFNYYRHLDYNACFTYVVNALSETGGTLGGEFGSLMVGESETSATKACEQLYPSHNPRAENKNGSNNNRH